MPTLEWIGKEKVINHHQQVPFRILNRKYSYDADGQHDEDNGSGNMVIRGDNLEALKALLPQYEGKVKCIYIDPPYNTGGDFVYPDDFSDSIENYKKLTGQVNGEGRKISTNSEANGRYHTDWLNMMYPRLRLARNLLTEDGVIFISIDDNEVYNLRKICDEVFGEYNYLNQISWVSNITGRQISGTGAAKTWESILVYGKDADFASSFNVDVKFAKSKMPDVYKGFDKDIRSDARGNFAVGDTLYNHNRKFNEETRPNLVFSIFYNPTTEEIIPGNIGEKKNGFVEILPHRNGDGSHKYHAWRWSKQKIIDEFYDLIVLPTSTGGYEIYTRIRDFNNTLLKDIITNVQNGDSELQKLFDSKKYFDYPKSVDLLYACLGCVQNQNGIVLDFFSGSATTAHSVMQLNAEDGGNCKFIMVQLPESCAEGTEAAKAGYKNICEIGKERIRRAGEKIKAAVEEQNAQMKIDAEPKPVPDVGFKVFKLDSSNLRKWQPDYENLERSLDDIVKNYVDGRSELDVVYEIMLKMGLDLTWPLDKHTIGGKNVYCIGMGALMICLDNDITTEVATGMVALHKELAPDVWKVVFKDNGFATDSAKVNIKEILKCAGLEEDAFTTV